MGLDKRFTYMNPGETLSPDENNLQRWATQPPVGMFYYNNNSGATVTVGGVWGQIAIPVGTNRTIDPLAMIGTGTSLVTFKEPGIYFVSLVGNYSGGGAVPGFYHASFFSNTFATPVGFNNIDFPLYNFHYDASGNDGMITISGYIVIEQADFGALKNIYKFMMFTPTAKNCLLGRLEIMLVSKVRPGKY